jgi:hypothetical protein
MGNKGAGISNKTLCRGGDGINKQNHLHTSSKLGLHSAATCWPIISNFLPHTFRADVAECWSTPSAEQLQHEINLFILKKLISITFCSRLLMLNSI